MNENHISHNFSIKELDLEHIVDSRIFQNYKHLCENVLEPMRAHFEAPVRISSGYRNPLKNKSVGGKSTSYHMSDEGRAAVDCFVDGIGVFIVFEWLRLESKLPFDKIILEYKNGVPQVVHIQTERTKTPRRRAFIGQTGDSQTYDEVPVL